MKSKKFIIERLKKIVSDLPSLKARYEFDIFSDTHFIEIIEMPYITSFISTTLLNTFKTGLIIKFAMDFPYESILFIDENDDIFQITKPDFEIEGIICSLNNELSFFNSELCPEFGSDLFYDSPAIEMPEFEFKDLKLIDSFDFNSIQDISNTNDDNITDYRYSEAA